MSAVLSKDRKYRYRLTRDFGVGNGACCFVMLNPSTADEHVNDPTIRRCIDFAKRFGCGSLEVVNLFALRATDPKALRIEGAGAIGPDNDQHIAEACNASHIIVCAWGNHGSYLDRAKDVLAVIRAQQGASPQALKINRSTGQPAHPLYLPAASKLVQLP
jgi:hypothetical protein